MKRYRCIICSYVYEPEYGDIMQSIPAGTPFEELPDDWLCPECGAVKGFFVPIE